MFSNKNSICFCADLDTFLLHAMQPFSQKHHTFEIQGKNITLEKVWDLKVEIGKMKMIYKANVEMFLCNNGKILLNSFSGSAQTFNEFMNTDDKTESDFKPDYKKRKISNE